MPLTKETTRVDAILVAFRNNKLIALLIAIGIVVVGFGQLSESVDKLLIQFGIRPNALSLARETQRDELSRQLTRMAWRRFFWSRVYLARVSLDPPAVQAEQDEAWHKYIEASEDWNSNLMVFILAVDQYYGHVKSVQLENDLQSNLNAMGANLIAVRFSPVTTMPEERKAKVNDATNSVDKVNAEFYQFVSGFRQGAR